MVTRSVLETIFENDCLKRENHFLRLDLRDQFAMAVLAGWQAQPDERTYGGRGDNFKDLTVDEWRAAILEEDAKYCYRMADAMMVARKNSPQS